MESVPIRRMKLAGEKEKEGIERKESTTPCLE